MASRPYFFKIVSKFVKVGFTMIKYQGMEFQTCNNVYEPAEDTFLLGDNLMVENLIVFLKLEQELESLQY